MPPLDLPDPPELLLRRTLAQLLADNGLGVYKTVGPYAKTEHGILTAGGLPTTFDDCTVLTSQTSTPDGRANMLYRVQMLTRIKTTSQIAAEQWAGAAATLLDQQAYALPILGISWSWESSARLYSGDSNGRESVFVNYAFRGRRVAE